MSEGRPKAAAITNSAASSSRTDANSLDDDVSFKVQYVESPMGFTMTAHPESNAEDVVQKAAVLGIDVFATMLSISKSCLKAEPTYPTVLGGNRNLNALQWSRGHKPFVAVSPIGEQGCGLLQQKRSLLEELEECRKVNDAMMESQVEMAQKKLQLQEALGCPKCNILSDIVLRMEKKQEETEKKLIETEDKLVETEKKWEAAHAKQGDQLSLLLRRIEDLRMVRRRNVIEKARIKAVRDIGMCVEDVESWHQFFTKNEDATMQLGISEGLFSLLKKGKRLLHKVVHEATLGNMADSVLSLDASSSERQQYEEAFRFAFDQDVNDFFDAAGMDEYD